MSIFEDLVSPDGPFSGPYTMLLWPIIGIFTNSFYSQSHQLRCLPVNISAHSSPSI